MLTNTHLQLYFDPIDRKRKELIQDSISLKYDLPIAREENRKIVEEDKYEYIQVWRKKYSQIPFKFNGRKERKDSQKKINDYLISLHQKDILKNHSEIKGILEEMGLKVLKFGRDIKKDFSYVTVENTSGKMRVQGEFYDKNFWEESVNARKKQIDLNKRSFYQVKKEERIIQVKNELKKENKKRFDKVQELFNVSRQRAEENSKNFVLEYGEYISLKEKRVNNESDRTKIRRRIEDSRANTENIVQRIREKRKFIYQSIESNCERQYSKERSNLSKIDELQGCIGELAKEFREFERETTYYYKIDRLIRRVNEYVKKVINRIKSTDFFSDIVRRQR